MSFGASFSIVKNSDPLELYVMSVPFMMHTYMHGKRMLNLQMLEPVVFTNGSFSIVVIILPNASLAPPSYYMFFPLQAIQVGISRLFIWIQLVVNNLQEF
jgi:hypothetical protein